MKNTVGTATEFNGLNQLPWMAISSPGLALAGSVPHSMGAGRPISTTWESRSSYSSPVGNSPRTFSPWLPAWGKAKGMFMVSDSPGSIRSG